MKINSKIIVFAVFGLVLLITGTAQAIENSFMAVFPLFAGTVLIINAYRLIRRGE